MVSDADYRGARRAPTNGYLAVFSKCSPAMEDGERYENMVWRLWARETLCCPPNHVIKPRWSLDRDIATGVTAEVLELSTGVASDGSIDPFTTSQDRSDSSTSRPGLRRCDPATSNARGKHMIPINLEKAVRLIQEKQLLEPMSPLPPHLAPQTPRATREVQPEEAVAPCSASPPVTAHRCSSEPSTSTFVTARGSDDLSATGSEANTSTDTSLHSIVRGFEPGCISTLLNFAPTPTTPKKIFSSVVKPPPSRTWPMMMKKQFIFTLRGLSDEYARSSLSENFHKAGSLKNTASLNTHISLRQYQEAISNGEGAIQSDSDKFEESTTEEEDSGDDWEDIDEEADKGDQLSMQTSGMFLRIDSKPNLTFRRSLLTMMMHEGDHAQAMQNVAQFQQPPSILRPRTTLPSGPSTGNSPQSDSGLMIRQQASMAQPTITTTLIMHPPALSPPTIRRFILQNELTSSLRKNLLWERQQKNATFHAAVQRAAITADLQDMSARTQAQPMNFSTKDLNSYFDQGVGSYHTKGW